MTPPSSSPPKPGTGSTGRSRWPKATRRVGAIGREWNTSSSASVIGSRYCRMGRWDRTGPPPPGASYSTGSDVRTDGAAQLDGRADDLVAVGLLVLEQRRQRGDPLAQAFPHGVVEPVGSVGLVADVGQLEQVGHRLVGL